MLNDFFNLILSHVLISITFILYHVINSYISEIYGYPMLLNSIWSDSKLNGLSIEFKKTYNRVLTKELCKLQSPEENEQLVAVAATTTVFHHFRI